MSRQLSVAGFFSGTAMLELGFEQAGFDVKFSNEINASARKTIEANSERHFGRDHVVLGDSIHTLSIDDVRKDFGKNIDGFVAGFPCLSYSEASDIHHRRVGVRYKQNDYERYARLGGDLFLHFARMIGGYQPKFFVFENVPSVEQAKIALETFTNMPCNDRGNSLGYYYKIVGDVFDARMFGLPQSRPRFFFVGCRWDLSLEMRPPAARRRLVVGDILEKDPELPYPVETVTLPWSGERVKICMPEYAKNRLLGLTCRDRPIITTAGPDAVAPTVVAHYARDRGTRLVRIGDLIRCYTPVEMARLQGIPQDYALEGSDSAQYVQAGNAVALPVAYSLARGIKEMLN